MWADISTERTILARAQQAVDRWLRNPDAESFHLNIARSADLYWDAQPDSQRLRDAFCEVAGAIRRGEGHAFRNREPLVRILRESLSDGEPVVSDEPTRES